MRFEKIATAGLFAGAFAAPLAAQASPNLLTNGSFEASPTTIAGWMISAPPYGTGPGFGPEIITTDGVTTSRYGDRISADPSTASPDGAGTQAVYFVDDAVTETISQTVSLRAGVQYAVGFDVYQPLSGARNPGDFSLAAVFNDVSVAAVSSTSTPAGTWSHHAGVLMETVNQTGQFSIAYTSGPGISKDALIDQVYVTAVPEPATAALTLTGAGMLGMASLFRRRARAR